MTPTADDAEQIRQLVARYNFAADLGDTDTLVDCFTDDGSFENVGLPADSPLAGRFEGREIVRAFFSKYHAASTGIVRHWNWNLLIDVDGDQATMQCYLMALTTSGGGRQAAVRSTGIYRDTLRRENGRWRFVSRQVTADS